MSPRAETYVPNAPCGTENGASIENLIVVSVESFFKHATVEDTSLYQRRMVNAYFETLSLNYEPADIPVSMPILPINCADALTGCRRSFCGGKNPEGRSENVRARNKAQIHG